MDTTEYDTDLWAEAGTSGENPDDVVYEGLAPEAPDYPQAWSGHLLSGLLWVENADS